MPDYLLPCLSSRPLAGLPTARLPANPFASRQPARPSACMSAGPPTCQPACPLIRRFATSPQGKSARRSACLPVRPPAANLPIARTSDCLPTCLFVCMRACPDDQFSHPLACPSGCSSFSRPLPLPSAHQPVYPPVRPPVCRLAGAPSLPYTLLPVCLHPCYRARLLACLPSRAGLPHFRCLCPLLLTAIWGTFKLVPLIGYIILLRRYRTLT